MVMGGLSNYNRVTFKGFLLKGSIRRTIRGIMAV